MWRSDKKPGWLLSTGLRLLVVAMLIHLAACSGSVTQNLVVTAMTPATVPATGGQISFSGNHFTSSTTVTIGGKSAQVYWGGPTLLTATAPASTVATAVDVVVANPGGNSVTLSKALTYQAPQTVPPVSNALSCTGQVCLYQAESPQNTLIGGAQINHCDGCMGGEKVGWLGGSGFVRVNDIYAPAAGTYTLTVYGIDGDAPNGSRGLTVAVNGDSVSQTLQVSGYTWNGTAPGVTTQVQLNQGSNSIEFGNSGNYAPDLDYITISPNTRASQSTCKNAVCTYNASSSSNTVVSPAVVVGCSECATGYKVGGYDGGNGSLTFNNVYAPVSGTYNLTIYGVDGDAPNYRTVTISVNGSSTQINANISGNNWNGDAAPVTVQVPLNQGANTLKFYTTQYNYSPQLDYIVVSPQPDWTPIGNGPAQINYDLNTGLASFTYNGATKISNFYSEVLVGGTPILSTSPSYTRAITTGANGETDVTLTANDGTPTMVQRFIMASQNYLLVQVKLEGANLSSGWMAPIVTAAPGSIDLGSYGDTRFLMVPFDNDSFRTYNAASSNGLNMATSYEVGAFYDNTSRNGLVIGSVTHDTWKTGITVNGSNNLLDKVTVFGGMTAPEDQVSHGTVTGSTIASPTVMVGFYSDWRTGMEQFASVNAQFAPKLTWTKPAPMGWSTWGHNQSSIAVGTALEDATYMHTKLSAFSNQGVSYLNLDANASWSDPQALEFTTTAHKQGQKAGAYWTPWVYWGNDLTQLVEGSNYTYGDIVMRDSLGNPLKTIDNAYAIDPTHPGARQRIDFYYLRFSTNGFDYVKFDFLSHGILEGGSNNGVFYDPTVHTGVQAYNQGMSYLAQKFGASMFMDASISPIFPYQYTHARRVSCDTFGGIGSPTQSQGGTTSYEMNSASYGWWLAGALYNYNDPDQMVLEGFTANENKSRVTSAAIQGYMFDGDELTDSTALALAQQWLTNPAINGLSALNLHFRPVDGNTGTNAANVLVAQSGNTYYLAVFNYDGTSGANVTVDLAHAGLGGNNYTVTDLWTSAVSSASSILTVALGPAESTILKLQ